MLATPLTSYQQGSWTPLLQLQCNQSLQLKLLIPFPFSANQRSFYHKTSFDWSRTPILKRNQPQFLLHSFEPSHIASLGPAILLS
ncbi:hypothetical protein QL285_046791 [Trifolium repens]|nr:hypothetical protein QL285_046791 [Trifolium repens]